jgi:hypothetical protein
MSWIRNTTYQYWAHSTTEVPSQIRFHKIGVKIVHLLVPGAKNDGGAEWSDGRVEGVGVHVRAHPLGQVRQGDGRTVVTPETMIVVHQIKDIV